MDFTVNANGDNSDFSEECSRGPELTPRAVVHSRPVRLTLLIPELLWPEPADRQAFEGCVTPGLDWLLGHAECHRGPRVAYETALAEIGGLGEKAPFGALRRLGEATPTSASDGHWLCADPVHLRFHHERIVLADAGAFDLTEDEAQTLVRSINAEFGDIGTLHVATARRWYLQVPVAVDPENSPLSTMAGKRLSGELSGRPSPLRRWLNELQMFLHGHSVNAARAQRGLPAVNSLWLWGAGSLPDSPARHFVTIAGNDPLARGLALATGAAPCPLPDHASQLLATDSPAVLAVLDSLLPPVLYEDAAGWRAALEALDRNWFSPLRTALGRGLPEIAIVAPTIYGRIGLRVAAGERWKLWKTPRSAASLARELAGPESGNTP